MNSLLTDAEIAALRAPGANPDPDAASTAHHATVSGLLRDLIQTHLTFTDTMTRYRDQLRNTPGDDAPAAIRDAYLASMTAASGHYTLAAVLERAMDKAPGIGVELACLADDLLTGGGDETICAGMWPTARSRGMLSFPGNEQP